MARARRAPGIFSGARASSTRSSAQSPRAANAALRSARAAKDPVVGHEATRTGAPLILLALMEAIERDTGAELFLVLERDGPLLESDRRVAHVLVNRQGWLSGLFDARAVRSDRQSCAGTRHLQLRGNLAPGR